ncbi:hypothetical protein KWH69_25905, partial [Escherichia coli]|nr:hypothetical protein [Escherichia coli]
VFIHQGFADFHVVNRLIRLQRQICIRDIFRTSHGIQKVELLENEDYASLLNYEAVQAFRDNALSPNHLVARGTAQNPDIYFQTCLL